MIDFYTYGTPNGRRVSVMLEETGLNIEWIFNRFWRWFWSHIAV